MATAERDDMYCTQLPAALDARPPARGDRACGHGVQGIVTAVPECQPLAMDDVWRVTLEGESFGRLARPALGGGWRLLRLDELTDAQLDALEAATASPSLC